MRPNASGEWTVVECDWFDRIKSMQNNFFWINQLEGSPIVFLYGIICTFGALANLVVLFAFIRTSNLRNLRNSFIVNLACSDLLLCVVTAPVTLYTSANLFWPFGNIACKVLASVQAVNTFVSSLTLALIAMDRVLLTTCPVKWRLAATAPIVCYCIVWIVSIVVALPYSLTVKSSKIDNLEPWNDVHTPAMLSICGRSYPEVCVEMQDTWDRAYISKTTFTIIVLAIQYLLPLFALAYAYVQIGSTIRRRSKVSRTIDQARRISMQSRNSRHHFEIQSHFRRWLWQFIQMIQFAFYLQFTMKTLVNFIAFITLEMLMLEQLTYISGKILVAVLCTMRCMNLGKGRRALLLLMILVLTYAICWAPMNIHNVLNGFDVISYSQYRYLFCHLVGISSACVNPITYALVNESFRNALHHMFLSFRPCYVTSGDSASSYITNSKPTKVTIRDPYSTKLDSPTKGAEELETFRNSML